MPAQFMGQFGFTQDKLSQMLMGLQQEESERRRMQMQLAMEKARINAENARLKLAEKQFEWQQEEAVAGREAETQQTQIQQAGALAQTQMEQRGALEQERIKQLGQIETERMKLEAPRFMTVGNTIFHANPATGELEEAAYVPEGVILKYGERLVDKGSGLLMAESEDVQQDKYYIYGLEGGELVSRAPKIPTPEGTYGVNTPEGNIEFRDLETDEIAEMIMTSDPAVANRAAMLTAQAKAKEVELEPEEAEKDRQFELLLEEVKAKSKADPSMDVIREYLEGLSPEARREVGQKMVEAELAEEGDFMLKEVDNKLYIFDKKTAALTDTGVRAGEVEPILMDIWNKVVARIKPEWYGMWGETEKQWVTSSLTVFIETDPRLTEEQRREYLARIPELANIQIEPGIDITLDTKSRALEWLKESAQWLFKIPPKAPIPTTPTAAPSRPSLDTVVSEAEGIAAGAGTEEERRAKVLALYKKRGVTEAQMNEYLRKKYAK